MPTQRPEYGPSGYLPPRAAKRARKIILREPLGLQWAIAAVIAGVLVLVAGVLVLQRSGPPGTPYVPAGALSSIDARGANYLPVAAGRQVLVVRGAGGVTVLETGRQRVSWCTGSGRLESVQGNVWEPSGRLIGGAGRSLARLPAQVYDGTIYVDPTAEGERLASQPQEAAPACTD